MVGWLVDAREKEEEDIYIRSRDISNSSTVLFFLSIKHDLFFVTWPSNHASITVEKNE